MRCKQSAAPTFFAPGRPVAGSGGIIASNKASTCRSSSEVRNRVSSGDNCIGRLLSNDAELALQNLDEPDVGPDVAGCFLADERGDDDVVGLRQCCADCG